jgi:uncharacterized membrane protein YoaK (UPF0700 family)
MTDIAKAGPEASPPKLLPMLLSFVAGYVDSCTYLARFGLFVAHAAVILTALALVNRERDNYRR